MSLFSFSVISQQPTNFYVAISSVESQNLIKMMMAKLSEAGIIQIADEIKTTNSEHVLSDVIPIVGVVDGRGLSCPMPLLKTKVALREVAIGEALYVLTTDPNSGTDIAAFCQQTQQQSDDNHLPSLKLLAHWQTDNHTDNLATQSLFHFIITKTDNN